MARRCQLIGRGEKIFSYRVLDGQSNPGQGAQPGAADAGIRWAGK